MSDWDAELKKIDRQLESMSDSALIPAPPANAPVGARAEVAAERAGTRTWGAFLRLALATALGVGILFWPYPKQCGVGILFWPYPKQCGVELAGYLAAVSAVTIAGLWSAVWTWRHRTARAHVLSLLLVVWGLLLGAMEVLPRVGYARVDAARPVGFSCPAPGTGGVNILRTGG
jgi:hypothetical protein